MFQRGLICTDLTDGLQRLTKFVDSLAQSGLQEITFFHSVPLWEEGEVPRIDEERIAEVKEIFNSGLGNVPTDVKVNIEVPSGDVVENVLKAIEKYNIDLMIKGVPLRKAWQEKILGTTSLKLTEKVKVPIMIFRPQIISVYREEEIALRCQHLNRFWLIPYQNSKTGKYLIEQVKHYAGQKHPDLRQQLLLLTIVEDTSRSQILIDSHYNEAQANLAKVKADLDQYSNLEVETLVVKGNAFMETIKVAFEYDISAIAIADDKAHGILDWTVPSYAQEILHRSWFPLLYFPVVKSPK